MHPSIVQQPPPPYYSTPGLENKALDHSMDLVMDDTSKNALYGGHAYSPYTHQTHPNGNECECLFSYVIYVRTSSLTSAVSFLLICSLLSFRLFEITYIVFTYT